MNQHPENAIPTSLLAALKASPKAQASTHSNSQLFAVGRRDMDFASLAGFLRSKGAGAAEINKWMAAIDNTLPVPHGADNIARVSNSIARYAVTPDVFTHDRFALHLATALHNKVLYCDGYGFLVYEDDHWQSDAEDLLVINMVRTVIAEVRGQIPAITQGMDEKQHKKFLQAAAKLESADFIRSSMKLLKADPAIRIKFADLNADKMLLNLANGTLDLRTGTLRPFNPSDKLNFKLNVAYDPNADCPAFRQFLTDILPEDVGSFILRSLGYGLLGHAREHKLLILQGTGRNGKSTLLEIMEALFAPLMVTIQPESLNGRMEGAIRNDLARLAGKRFMITSETRSGTVLDSSLIKQITGLDMMTARYLYKEHFQFQPHAVPFIITNYAPVIDGSDFAMASRVLLVAFDTVITEPDRQLPEKLKAEASGILNLVLAGMNEYKANGLMIPDSVTQRSNLFVERSNLLKSFFDDTFEPHDDAVITASNAYRFYDTWCRDNGYKPMSMNQFKDAFERTTGVAQERNNQGRYWPNLRLRVVK